MNIKTLKVTLQGPLWSLDAFEIEGVDVINRWSEDPAKEEGSVTVTDFELSTDDLLDIFIKVGAPNHSIYKVVISGKTENPKNDIDATIPDLEVKKNGRLNILISKDINEIIK